ncbi:MAG: ORF6N domain-containing protein [Verrucomicrobiota bacterium]|nr:ORF6N domain-containing protein [Verrucomicrobiota bacterium]
MTSDDTLETVENAIHLIRGQRVMLDSDLARIYGTSTVRLNQQVRRNLKRFPCDFAFQLEREEFAILISQSVISSLHGGRRKLPWVFTEHGAVMLASVLNSEVAIDASIRVVRAFIRLREMISANTALAAKFAELENRLDSHDTQIAQLFAAIRQLLAPSPAKKREIGFHVRETAPGYRAKRKA